MHTRRSVNALVVSVAAVLLFAVPSPGQDSALLKKVEEIEKQVRGLEKAVQELRGKTVEDSPRSRANTNDVWAQIRFQGLERSKAMETLGYLTDVIGPRLTGSPNMRRANDWTRDTLSSWGLSDARLEAWGPFGRGWSVQSFSLRMIEPQFVPLIAAPKAWSPGFETPLEEEIVYVEVRELKDLEKYKGKVKGKIVLAGAPRELQPHFEPLATRMAATNLLRLANAAPTVNRGNRAPPADAAVNTNTFSRPGTNDVTTGTNNAAPSRGPRRSFQSRLFTFLAEEGAAVVLTPSAKGDGGTVFVSGATVPDGTGVTNVAGSSPAGPRAWSTNAPAMPAQIMVAIEDYNRLVRMVQRGEKLKLSVDLKVRFHSEDLMAYNTIAEIPGSDLRDEIVMLGGHLDSWHAGTGATDNGVGVVATMEAVRILKALDLKPRRTVRIALWSGEEQGLLGSKAYVAQHFGYFTNHAEAALAAASATTTNATPQTSSEESPVALSGSTNSPATREFIRGPEFEKISAYFNLDNGAGKIRGVYMQNNEAVRPIFRQWLDHVSDLGAETLSTANTGATDHISFDQVGIPGFQFIQDPLEYGARTHHSNQDVFDRIQADDLKQAATVIATLVYEAAMADEKLPRKPGETTSPLPARVAQTATQVANLPGGN